jgi:mannitol 2-dehydrogenase
MTLLSVSEIVGTRLPAHEGFVALYLALRKQLEVQGAAATLRALDSTGGTMPARAP